MAAPLKVLHLAAHLGGGVGRALAALTAGNRRGGKIEDSFICLEAPRDARFAESVRAAGAAVAVAPALTDIRAAMRDADIVQIEWWHHPLLAKTLLATEDVAARRVVWAHTSGLHYPAITPAFAALPHAFVATAAASLPLLKKAKRADVAHSAGGFDAFPPPAPRRSGPPRAGYLGSLNPAKLHPDILRYVQAAGIEVDFHGETGVNPGLEGEVRRLGAASPVRLRGFCEKPQDVLSTLDLFVYLLNPAHYGTTENALLEAMACGAVPVVMNNPVESGIVRDGVTGFVVDSPETFAAAVRRLADDPGLRQRIGSQASAAVRTGYTPAAATARLTAIYRAVMNEAKTGADFRGVFGATGAEMFLSCLGAYAPLFAEGREISGRAQRLGAPVLYEKSKASAFQFRACFPDDTRLAAWEAMLYTDLTAEGNPR